MEINDIIGRTRIIGAPKNWNEKYGRCEGLPVRDEVINGANYMFSAWQPTAEDRTLIAAGEPVLLGVMGSVHPVVRLSVGYSPEYKEAYKAEFSTLEKVKLWHDDISAAPHDKRILIRTEQNIYTVNWVKHPETGHEAWLICTAEDGTQMLIGSGLILGWQVAPDV